MTPMRNEPAYKKDSFTFLSFLPCDRHSKSGSNDSGISTSDQRIYQNKHGVVVISDDEESNEPEFEMLCELEFDQNVSLPKPIEQKLIFKAEPEKMQEFSFSEDQLTSSFNTTQMILKDEADATANQSECEDELLPLCRVENIDAVPNTNYILFICPQCGSDFPNSSTWKSHIDKAHNLNDQSTFNFTKRPNNKFQCNKCQTIITRCTLKTLQQHRFSHLPFKVYKCELCRHDERSVYQMISHIMLHKEKEEAVDVIGTSDKNSELEHKSKHHIAFICPLCGITFDAEDTWQAHINFKHNFLEKTAENRFGDHFKCLECGEEIFSQHVTDLQQHLFTHLPFKSFLKCKICGWTISRRSFMVSHILNLHQSSTTRIAATITNDKLSTSLSNVFIYDDDNDDEDIANVPEIEQSANKAVTSMIKTSSAHPMETSVERRYRNRGFRCARCPLSFPTAAQRNDHNVTKHGKYVCHNCKENFAIKSDLKRHNCTKLVSYDCPKCRREYNYEKCYRNHVRRCNFQRTRCVREESANKFN